MACLNSGWLNGRRPGWSNLGHCYTLTWACVGDEDTGIYHTHTVTHTPGIIKKNWVMLKENVASSPSGA